MAGMSCGCGCRLTQGTMCQTGAPCSCHKEQPLQAVMPPCGTVQSGGGQAAAGQSGGIISFNGGQSGGTIQVNGVKPGGTIQMNGGQPVGTIQVNGIKPGGTIQMNGGQPVGAVPVNMGQTREFLMGQIREAGFAMDDVLLYLDTHPSDAAALSYYKQAAAIRNSAVAAYESQYGPLTVNQVKGDRWSWVTETWPWEGGY